MSVDLFTSQFIDLDIISKAKFAEMQPNNKNLITYRINLYIYTIQAIQYTYICRQQNNIVEQNKIEQNKIEQNYAV